MGSSVLDPSDYSAAFTLFPLLSPELRTNVWHQALLIPRLVLIYKHDLNSSTHVRRSVYSPLLAACRESRAEALTFYTPQHVPERPASSNITSYRVVPGSDIVYVVGTDSPYRHYKPVSWTCVFLSQDISSPNSSFVNIKRLAVNEEFLRSTPFLQCGKMPYSVWKLVVLELRALEELFVVCEEVNKGWGEVTIKQKLLEARERYLELWDREWSEEEETVWLRFWKCPIVVVLSLEKLVASSWV